MILYKMKKITFILLILSLHAGTFFKGFKPSDTQNYVFSLDYRYMTDDIKKRYYQVIMDNSRKYELNPLYLAKQIHAESTFKWWTGNKIAFGSMGVRPKYWSHVLYRIDTNIIKYVKTEKDHIKYLKRIGYGVEVGSYVMRYYLDRNDDNYPLALMGYWAGMNSRQYRKAKRCEDYRLTNSYVSKIID